MAAVLSDDKSEALEEREINPLPIGKQGLTKPKPNKPKGLTAKQEKFARHVALGSSQADAYRASYDVEGMTDKSVYNEAYSLMQNPAITEKIASLKAVQVRLDWQDMNRMRALALETLATEAQGLGPDTKTNARVAAAVAIGKITDINLFADHKVIEHVDHRQLAALTTKLEQRLSALMNKAQSSPNQALTRLEHQPEPEKAPAPSSGPHLPGDPRLGEREDPDA